MVGDCLGESVEVFSGFGANGEATGRGGVEVGFVGDDEGRSFNGLRQGFILGLPAGLGIVEVEDEIGVGGGFAGFLDADFFDLVGCFSEAGCVDEADGETAEVDGFFDRVAGGAGDGGDNGSLLAEEGVEE